MITVAIHQPNFFPWLGYFDKIARCDKFVFLDNVQYPKSGKGQWMNRVMLNISGNKSWLTAPVDRSHHGLRMIDEMMFSDGAQWRRKAEKTIVQNYCKRPHFEAEWPWLRELLMNEDDRLLEYNMKALTAIIGKIGMDMSKTVLASQLEINAKATEMLIGLTKAAGGDAYMCGGGAKGYQNDSDIESSGLKLIYQDFAHPVYPQGCGEFMPGLSIMDAIFNIGTAAVAGLFPREAAARLQ